MECYVIVVNWLNARSFSENQMLFGRVKKTWLFCDFEKTDRLSGVLEACDEALFSGIITNSSSFAGVSDLH